MPFRVRYNITRIPRSHIDRKLRLNNAIPTAFILTDLGASASTSLDTVSRLTGMSYTYKDLNKPYQLSKLDLYLLKGERDIVSGFERCIFRDKVDILPELNLFRSTLPMTFKNAMDIKVTDQLGNSKTIPWDVTVHPAK